MILSHDGKRLVLMEAERNGDVRMGRGQRETTPLHTKRFRPNLPRGAFSPDGRTLAIDDFSGTNEIRLCDLATGKERMLGKTTHFLFSMVFSPDGKRLTLADQEDKLVCWNVANGKELWKRARGPRGMGFSPDGRILAVGDPSDPAHIRLIDAATGKSLDQYKFPGIRGVYRVQFAPAGRRWPSARTGASSSGT